MNLKKLKLGKNNYITNDEYHGDRDYLSSSALKMLLFDINKFHSQYILNQPSTFSSSAMDLGSYVHSLILEPENTESDFAIYPGIKRGENWEKFRDEELNGRTVLSVMNSRVANEMVETYKDNSDAVSLLKDGEAEYTIASNLNGVNVKVRADWWDEKNNNIVDIKTTSSNMNKKELEESIGHFNYDLSTALYIDTFKSITGKEVPDFYFIFIGSRNTKTTVVFKASKKLIENGRRKYKAAIKKYLKLKKSGEWLDTGVEEIGVPTWALFDEQ